MPRRRALKTAPLSAAKNSGPLPPSLPSPTEKSPEPPRAKSKTAGSLLRPPFSGGRGWLHRGVRCFSLRSKALVFGAAAQYLHAFLFWGMRRLVTLSFFTAPPFKGKVASGGLRNFLKGSFRLHFL